MIDGNETLETEDRIALFDMDGTLCDYSGQLKRDLEKIRNPAEPEIEFQHDDSLLPAWYKQRMHLIKSVPGWWKYLPRLEDGFQVLDLAVSIGFTPEILTKGPFRSSQAWTEKYEWCRREIDGKGHSKKPIEIGITFNKGRVYGRMLVEDYPPYVEAWLKFRKRGFVVLMDRPYNRSLKHPQVERYDGTQASLRIIVERTQAAFDRKTLPSCE